MGEYSKYEPSGIGWIGDIPYDWKVNKFNRIIIRVSTGLNPRNNFKLGDGDCYYVTIKNFKKGKLFLDEKCDRMTKEALNIINERSDLKIDDILFSSIGEEAEAYLISEHPTNWNINESVFTIRVNKDILLPKFFYYLITNKSFFNDLIKDATGSTFKSIKIKSLIEKKIPVPSLSVQENITIFLDDKTEKIDALISDKEKLIKLFREYRQSVISETVTKGLDKKVQMKPSGIEWIGDIPYDWNIIRVKRVFKNIKTLCGNNVDKYERLALTKNGVIKRSKEDAKGLQPTQFEGYQILKENELIFRLIDLKNVKTDRVGLSAYTGIVSPAYTILNNRMTDNRFYYYYFMVMDYNKIFNNLGGEGVRRSLNVKDLLKMPIILISEEKQKEISDFLDKKISCIDNLIENITKQIKKLQEYRKSIISEAVTGKAAI